LGGSSSVGELRFCDELAVETLSLEAYDTFRFRVDLLLFSRRRPFEGDSHQSSSMCASTNIVEICRADKVVISQIDSLGEMGPNTKYQKSGKLGIRISRIKATHKKSE
jgi:L-cysteine desulfidase